MNSNPLTAIDFYKSGHIHQYPSGVTEIYANFTPRAKHANSDIAEDAIVFFGLQYFIKDFLINTWQKGFFNKKKEEVILKYKKILDHALGKDTLDISHIGELHDLGYLPLKIKALAEGTIVPIGVPVLTVVNTHSKFFWLTNYIETILSCYLWKTITSATTAFYYKKLLQRYAEQTGSQEDFINFQAFDFSFRGMSGYQDAAMSGAAHLTSFYGTATIPAVDLLEDYYSAMLEKEVVGCSIPSTEHSVMCVASEDAELSTFRKLINETYPTGNLSIVSDTWDFWRVITDYIPKLKTNILKRDGKLVIRPDSGDPVKIIAGDFEAPKGSAQYKGTIECLWDVFGGSITAKGYKLLDPHIGVIYGDSITLQIAKSILAALEKKNFASANIVFGIGSSTYQYVKRDSFYFAYKTTSCVVNGERKAVFKNPKTDSGIKKSAKGLLRVEIQDGSLIMHEEQSEEQEKQGALTEVFYNGKITKTITLSDIRRNLWGFEN